MVEEAMHSRDDAFSSGDTNYLKSHFDFNNRAENF